MYVIIRFLSPGVGWSLLRRVVQLQNELETRRRQLK